MARRCMDQGFVQALRPHDFLGFDTVLLRILFKIQIVEQPHDSPEIHLIFIAQLLCKVSHNTFHGLRMLQMEFVLVVSDVYKRQELYGAPTGDS